MEEKFKTLLQPGETLLWCGRPAAFETLDKTNKSGILIATAIKVVVMTCLIGSYVAAAARSANFNTVILFCLFALTAFVIAMPFLTASHLRKRIVYGLSDRRILRAGFAEGGVPYKRIKTAALRTDSDGHTTLLCGPRAMKLPAGRWRANADTAFSDDADVDECTGAVLYALPMDDELEALLREHLPL